VSLPQIFSDPQVREGEKSTTVQRPVNFLLEMRRFFY
jgi:hypothetical protein